MCVWNTWRVYHGCGELLVLLGDSEAYVWLPFLFTPFTCYFSIVGWSCKWIKDGKDKNKDTFKLNFIPDVYNYFIVGTFLLNQEKDVYPVE